MSTDVYTEVVNGPLAHAKATGTVAGRAAEFVAVHRQENDTPATASLTMTVPMSLEDITAALWILVSDGYPVADLREDGPAHVHALVLETVLAEGCSALDVARLNLASIAAGSQQHSALCELRSLVTELYGSPRRSCRATRTTSRRELTRVSA